MRTVNHSAAIFTTVAFAAVIFSAGTIQTIAELRRGEWPESLRVFRQMPTAANLRSFETDLEQASLVIGWLRPPAQFARFQWLADAGDKSLVGREGWLFYRPGIQQAARGAADDPSASLADPLPAIVSFRDQLAQRGVRLLVVPVPNKESIYPELVSARAAGRQVAVGDRTAEVLRRLDAAGVEFLDLFEVYRRAKQSQTDPSDARYYLAQDTHWSPEGVQLAAEAVARRLLDLGWIELGPVDYEQRAAPVQRVGDLLQMLQLPRLPHAWQPETCNCRQVVRLEDETPYRDDSAAEVLVIGDSFLRIYQQDEPGSAGFVAHVARELHQPLMSVINDGGGATLVRQELARRPALLAGKTVVVWEFVERDLHSGTDGWQLVPLPQITCRR
ncbi:MAG: hypothetical protein KJ000_11485 [Pirellulaceae bacterium]|nr:hypothetical protein [Pirellulaceae bacterium]